MRELYAGNNITSCILKSFHDIRDMNYKQRGEKHSPPYLSPLP